MFSHWSELSDRLARSSQIALFLDFDGTLAPIQSRPETVRVVPGIRSTLTALARRRGVRVWVISARRRADIRARVRVPGVRYLGLYGWERTRIWPSRPGVIAGVRQALGARLPRHPAVWIEDKEYTLAVHYRGAPDAIRMAALECVYHAVEPLRSELRIALGKCVWEVVPLIMGNKGAAVRREMAALPSSTLPLYIGDDLSDESAFAALSPVVGIRVGGPEFTRARYRLDSPEQVHRFLDRLRRQNL